MLFKEYDNAFRNSGLILYTLGFMVADAMIAITEQDFYENTKDSSKSKYIAMIDPFLFYYWTQGSPATKYEQENEFVAYDLIVAQLCFCLIQSIFGLAIFSLVVIIDNKRFKSNQSFDNKSSLTEYINNSKAIKKYDLDCGGEYGCGGSASMIESNDQVFVKDLSKLYKMGKLAVEDISFKIKTGEITGILGPNGAGKTSLFNILTMIQPRSDGLLKIKGRDIISFCPTS